MARLSADRGGATDPSVAREPPPDLAVRRFGRWTCGAGLPWGRASSSLEILRRAGPGKAWRLIVDIDGFAQLQVVGAGGRARQGCWANLSADELAGLQGSVRGAALCDRPNDRRASDAESAFDVDIHLPDVECSRHFNAPSLLKSAQGRRFDEGIRWWLDRASNGSFHSVEAFAVSNRPGSRGAVAGRSSPARRAGEAIANERLTCGPTRATIYEAGDSWLLDYSFQKGWLWRRDLEISSTGMIAIDFSSFHTAARASCTGQLSEEELSAIRGAIARARICEMPPAEVQTGEDRAYVSVRQGEDECQYLPVRPSDLRASWRGRNLDDRLTAIVANLVGQGGLDPFDARTGLLFDGRPGSTTRAARDTAARVATVPARTTAPPGPRRGFAWR